MTDSMNFGPEWLRNLSQDGCTQPCATSAPRYQLAEHRYGREEMLALFDRVVKAPEHLSSIPGLYIEKTQLPLALIPMTEEETRMWNRGINSDAVLRLSGKAPTGMAGGPRGGRGGSVDRGRGRGRGTYHYSRGVSYEEPGDNSVSIPRNIRPFERSQGAASERGWSERNGADPGDWNGSTSPRKDFGGGRGFMNDNWRRHRGNSTEDDDGWRTATNNRSEKWIRSSSWREGDKDDGGKGQNWERGRNWDEPNTHQHSRRLWDTDDNLPEWATENLSESGGSFDASGAFHGGGFSDNEEEDGGHVKESKSKQQLERRNQSNNISRRPSAPSGNTTREREKDPGRSVEEEPSPPSNAQEAPSSTSQPRRSPTESAKKTPPPATSSVSSQNSEQSKAVTSQVESAKVSTYNNSVVANCVDTNVNVNNKGEGEVPKERVKVGRQKSEDDMDHMQEVADDLVAKLMEDEDKVTPTPSEKWFYQDPQGDVQGPFLSSEMAEWFRAGYFTLNLLVRRNCDERFSQLGDLIKMCGRIPFLPGPSFPPLKAADPVTAATTVPTTGQPTVTQGVPPTAVPPTVVPPAGVPPAAVPVPPQLDQEAMLMRQYQYQLLHGQLLLRQQAVLGKLSQTEHWPTLSNVEKQQQVMQQMLAQQPLDPGMAPFMAQTHKNPLMQLLSQLQHPPNVPNAVPESQLSPSQLEPLQQLIQQMGGLQHPPPHLHPDTDPNPIQTLLRQLGNKAPKPAMESVWGGVSPVAHSWLGPIPTPAAPPGQLWDLHGKDIKTEQQILEEQMKAEEERRREELRKQEETQRRTQEEEKRKQLEEELRKSDIEKQRLQEKMLRLEEERRQEERLRKEEERKRLEEKRRLEEKLQQEEELRRQQEEAKRLEEEAALARKREEALKKKEEEKRRKEEEKEKKRKAEEERKREEEERRRLEEEKRKQEEEESQVRRLEQQRRQTEALRRLQEQQQQRSKAAPWSPTVQPPVTGSSLADIQRQEKEKKEREQQLLLQLQQQQQQQQMQQQSLQANTEPPPSVVNNKSGSSLQLKWAERKSVPSGKVKSLAEIQAEEQEQLAKQQERERAERAQQQKEISLPPSAGIWGAASQSLSWTTSQTTSVWGNTSTTTVAGNTVSGAGFWEEVAPPAPKPSATAKPAGKTKSTGGSKTRTKKEEAVVMKLFEQNVSRGDEFTQWCSKALGSLQSSVDIPTFVGFLRDIESPYEVKDYVRLYLGEGKEAQDFARQFLERRSKWRSAQRAAPLEDDMCVPAPAINPVNTDFQEVKGKGKKAKKSKFRVDKSILGFNVIAAEDRINVGDRDYGEGL